MAAGLACEHLSPTDTHAAAERGSTLKAAVLIAQRSGTASSLAAVTAAAGASEADVAGVHDTAEGRSQQPL